jgi:signal transduction histidine kinase
VRGRTKLGFAIFEITDNGRGIDAKDHQRIFDLFRRAGRQDKPGQGIGLAHVRALVRRLGGTMSVASELNHGSTFTITLPIKWSTSNRNRDP